MISGLAVSELSAGYSGHPVVRDLDLTVAPGEIVALLGPNGAGKTTLLLTLAGLLPRLGGSARVDDKELPASAAGVNRGGVVLVPDDRSLFRSLTVTENLQLARRKGGLDVDAIVELFPGLGNRLNVAAGTLSGGEQQMLAIGRALVQTPRVLLIDELSMGLAPIVVDRILAILRSVADSQQLAVVLVEQYVRPALATADRAVVLVRGRVALGAPADELLGDLRPLEQAYMS